MADPVTRVTLCAAAALTVAATALSAQQEAPSPLDSVRSHYRAEVILLRDSVARVSAATFHVRRDWRLAADETLRSQTRRLRDRCTMLRAALADHRSSFDPASAPDSLRRAVIEFRPALDRLRRDLRTSCESWIPAEAAASDADSLRAWAPSRLSEIDRAIESYHAAVARFARQAGFRMPTQSPR